MRVARLGRAEAVAVRGGSSPYGSGVVQNRTNLVARRPRVRRAEAAVLCGAGRSPSGRNPTTEDCREDDESDETPR
jgi:hypothetical protein